MYLEPPRHSVPPGDGEARRAKAFRRPRGECAARGGAWAVRDVHGEAAVPRAWAPALVLESLRVHVNTLARRPLGVYMRHQKHTCAL